MTYAAIWAPPQVMPDARACRVSLAFVQDQADVAGV